MKKEEIAELTHQAIKQISDTSSDIIKWSSVIEGSTNMKANEDAQIYDHLHNAFHNILEPDVFPTLLDPQGYKRIFNIGKHLLEVTVTHRATNMEEIFGVDVFYNYENWKVLAFQHKKRHKDGGLSLGSKEIEQQEKIMKLCCACSKQRGIVKTENLIIPFCASLYVIGSSDSPLRHIVSACKLDEYRKIYRSHIKNEFIGYIPIPGDLETIDKMFLQCLVGRIIKSKNNKTSILNDVFLAHPDILFTANLTH